MEFFDAAKTKAHTMLQQGVNAVKAVPTKSEFLSEGMLIPDEFIAAGDLLVNKCPTWSWQSGDPTRSVAYLPKDKQFLLTRNVPCHERAHSLERKPLPEKVVEEDGSDWVVSSYPEEEGGGGDQTKLPPPQQLNNNKEKQLVV